MSIVACCRMGFTRTCSIRLVLVLTDVRLRFCLLLRILAVVFFLEPTNQPTNQPTKLGVENQAVILANPGLHLDQATRSALARLYIGTEGLQSMNYNNAVKGDSLSSTVDTWITTKGTYWFEHLNSTSATDPICSNDFYDGYNDGSSSSSFSIKAIVTIAVGSTFFLFVIGLLFARIAGLKARMDGKLADNDRL